MWAKTRVHVIANTKYFALRDKCMNGKFFCVSKPTAAYKSAGAPGRDPEGGFLRCSTIGKKNTPKSCDLVFMPVLIVT